jgi:hypothetical protein
MGQDAPDEDYNLVEGNIDPAQAMLRELDIYFWVDTDVVPDEAFIPLAHAMAMYCASDFGQQADQAIVQLGIEGEQRLQKIQSERPHFTPLEIQAY